MKKALHCVKEKVTGEYVKDSKNLRKTYRRLTLSVVLLFVFICLGWEISSVYAKEDGAAVVSTTVAPYSKHSTAAQKEDLPVLALTLQDEQGQPIAGIEVSAMEGDLVGKEKERARTDENGKVVFKRLTSGTYYFFANIDAIRSHSGYGLPAMIRKYKTSHSYYISESRQFDFSSSVECAYIIKKGEFIWFDTYHDYYRANAIVVVNKAMGIEQIIPVASTDCMQIYLPMHKFYQITTVKNDAFDAWVFEIYSHKGLHLDLL